MTSFIQIIVPEQFSKQHIQEWFKVVETTLPSGMIGETVIVLKDSTKTVRYHQHRTANKKFAYIISLIRDLELSEIHNVVEAWCKVYPKGDFLIDYSQAADLPQPKPQGLEQSKIAQVLQAWAQRDHARWMRNLIAQGWRYGTTLSTKNKTHPWLQSWEQLPRAAREQNIEGVQDLLKILRDFGYSITQIPEA